jgi:hypothetical protein
MPEDARPNILIVDDESTSEHELGLDSLAATRARHPNDLGIADLEWADLVLMDFIIKDWDERDKLEQVSLQPQNGLALAAVLREHADTTNNGGHRYTAFAMHSAHIGDISARLHTTNRTPYVVARLNNLEWVFDKADAARFSQSVLLAMAVRRVSELWSTEKVVDIDTATTDLLRLGADAAWCERAAEDVVLCQIPLSDFSAGTNGLLFLRWLLHGILPYPTFLLASPWVATRLRISTASLREVMGGKSELARNLAACRYTGLLAEFGGARWWRAAVDEYTWGLRAAGAREPIQFHAELEKRAGILLEHVDAASPVVCVDHHLEARDELAAIESTVRLVPDLWPGYADPAYGDVESVSGDAGLRSIVHPFDRDRLLDPNQGE